MSVMKIKIKKIECYTIKIFKGNFFRWSRQGSLIQAGSVQAEPWEW